MKLVRNRDLFRRSPGLGGLRR